MVVTVECDDLLSAFEFVGAAPPGENNAYVCVATGRIHCMSEHRSVDENVPDDLETSDRYVLLPPLDSEGVLDEWYRYEAEATDRALRAWCEVNGLRLK